MEWMNDLFVPNDQPVAFRPDDEIPSHSQEDVTVKQRRDDKIGAIPLVVCGDITDGPGWDASEKRLYGSGMERLMGTIWNPDLALCNALFDTLRDKDKRELDFSSIYTTNYRDPIFNFSWQKVWIDHIMYSRNTPADWVTGGQSHIIMESGKPMWEEYPNASDHFLISAELEV